MVWRFGTFCYSCCYIKTPITQHNCPRFVFSGMLSSQLFMEMQFLMSNFLLKFSDWYRATLSSFSRSRNEQANGKFSYNLSFMCPVQYSVLFFLIWLCLILRKRGNTLDGNSAPFATFSGIKREDPYHQTSIVITPM